MNDLSVMKGRKTRLLFFLSGTGRLQYGVAEVFRHVLNGLNKERYEPYLVITGTLSGPVEALSDEVKVIELHRQGLKKAFFPLVRTLRELQPDIVVSAMEHPNVLAVLARMVSRQRFKLVLTTHNVLTPRLEYMWSRKQGWLIHNAVKLSYPHADQVVCVSNAVLNDLKSHVTRLPASTVIYNPVLRSVALPTFFSAEKQQGLIVTSSRLVSYKKVDEVVRALAILEHRFRLVVMGDGPERSRLEALVFALDLDDRVKFTGYVVDPFAVYRKAEIFVLPSMWEGFGNVLIESMACGCQVVANASAWAPPEVLGHGEYGFLYEGGDPERLAASIREAAEKPKAQDKLIGYAHLFTDIRVAIEYMSVFEQVVSKR